MSQAQQQQSQQLLQQQALAADGDNDGDDDVVVLNDNGAPVKENTGRWTYGEHCLFLKGLEQHGKGWKKIASLIRTRTVVQIRTHAQKYFQKLAKAKQNGDHGDVGMDSKGGGKRKHRNKRKPTAVVHYSSLATAAYASHNHILLLRIVELDDLFAGATALAPSLQPYVSGAGAIESGLYKFLSPKMSDEPMQQQQQQQQQQPASMNDLANVAAASNGSSTNGTTAAPGSHYVFNTAYATASPITAAIAGQTAASALQN
eukprot:19823-Heterococcus_DN1.PRE.1